MTAERKRAARCQGSNGAAGRQAVARHTERLQLLRGQALAKHTGQDANLNVLSVHHMGINNLPKQAKDSLAQLLGQIPHLLNDALAGLLQDSDKSHGLTVISALGAYKTCVNSCEISSDSVASTSIDTLPLETAALLAQAQALGYANQAELISTSLQAAAQRFC